MNQQVQLFGNYVLLEKLASGGMAEIFLARPAVREGDGRLLVVKRILPHIANHSEFLNMFQREIQIIMGFTHSHVVQLHDFGSVNYQPYIAMEYIEGKSLRDVSDRLKARQAKMPISEALSLVAQAASGLHYAHTFEHKTTGKPLNTIHRDISPHNLIVSFDGNLKVIDFGIAKAACSVLDLSQTGTVKGKAGYFSPEQLEGHSLDARTDIFSLGVVAWELLTGEKLFAKPGDTEVSIMKKVSQSEKHIVPPSQLNKDIPADVDHVILKALEKDPNNRFRDARQFQAELRKPLMKYYPDYTYADTGELVRNLFSEDIIDQRRKMQELNQSAQEMLLRDVDDNTTVITVGGIAGQAAPEKGVELSKTSDDVLAFRLANIETALKQKASTRHYMMLAFYVISIIALKFGDLYHIWNDYVTPKAAAEMTTSNSTAAHLAKSSGPHRGSNHSSKVH
jgi:serine/threonine protein kinase